jgi:hypothetical protein
MGKDKSPEQVWEEVVVHVANRDGLAELDSFKTADSGQPGGWIRKLLHDLCLSKFGRSLKEAPITHITNEREGD